MGQDVTPRAPQRRKAPAAGARPNIPVPGQNPEGGFLRPRAGHSVPKARPLPPAEPSVSPHSPTRQAAGRSPGRGGRRRPDGREAARGTATKSRGRGAPGEALQLEERERRTTQRRKEATAASASHGASRQRGSAPGQPHGEGRGGRSGAGTGAAEGGGGKAPRAAAQPRPAAPGREPAAPGKGTEEGEGGRPRPGRGPAVRAGPASPHLRRPPPRSTAGLSSSLDPSSPGTGPTAAYPQRIRPSRRRDREGRAPRLPPLCPRAPGSARLPPADRRDRATAAPGASPAPLPSPHPSERRHRRGRRRARSGRVPRRNTEEAEPNGRESESAARLKGTGRPPAGEEERAAPPSPGPARREKPLSVRRGVAERVQPGAVRGGRDSLSRFPCSLSVPLLPSEPPFPQRGSRFLFFFSFFSEDT